MSGCVYGVGVGPGDPELLTLKAVRILREADVIVHSGEKPKDSRAYQIAVQAVPEIAAKEMLSVHVPMTYDRMSQEEEHHKTALQIGEYLEAGKSMAFLVLGDPSIYSSFSYIRKILNEEGYRTETICGVPSFCAVAARLNIPLVEWDEQMHIIPAAQKMHPADPEHPEIPEETPSGTRVYMKVGRQLPVLKESLKGSGSDIYMVRKCGMEGEEIFHGISQIPDEAGYFATVITKPRL